MVATVDGAQQHTLGLGVFQAGTRQALRASHRVQVGSIGKTLLSLAVLRLVSQGRLALDAPLSTLLPALTLHNPWGARSPVLLRHLLDMSAGLPDLQPLGMGQSSFNFSRQGDDPELAWGHLGDGQPVADWPVAVRPAALFTTTAADMARLMQFLLGDGRIEGRPFLRRDLLDGLGLAPSTHAARAGLRSGYGLGLFTRDRHGAVGLCHGGSTAGWRAMFCIYRAAQRGFFIAINQDREGANYGLFDAQLVRHLGLPVPWADTAPDAATSPPDTAWNGLYVPAPGRLQALALPDRLLGFWWLDLTPGKARLREGLGPARALVLAGQGLYRQADRVQATLALLRDEHGRPRVAGTYVTLRRVAVWEQAVLWASAIVGVLALLAALPVALWRLWRLCRLCRMGRMRRLQRGPWRHARRAALERAPVGWALLLLAAAVAAWALRGWQHLAEFNITTAAVAVASVLWPLACLAQLVQAWRHRHAGQGAGWDAAVALAGLQLAVLLAAYGGWPLLPWRL